MVQSLILIFDELDVLIEHQVILFLHLLHFDQFLYQNKISLFFINQMNKIYLKILQSFEFSHTFADLKNDQKY